MANGHDFVDWLACNDSRGHKGPCAGAQKHRWWWHGVTFARRFRCLGVGRFRVVGEVVAALQCCYRAYVVRAQETCARKGDRPHRCCSSPSHRALHVDETVLTCKIKRETLEETIRHQKCDLSATLILVQTMEQSDQLARFMHDLFAQSFRVHSSRWS